MYLIIAFYKNWWNLIVFRPKPTGELEAQVFLLSLMSVTFITFHQVLIIVQRDEGFIPFVICSNPHQWPEILLLYLRFLKLFPERVALWKYCLIIPYEFGHSITTNIGILYGLIMRYLGDNQAGFSYNGDALQCNVSYGQSITEARSLGQSTTNS